MARLSVRQRMARSIARRKGEIVMRADFAAMGSPSQISRALKDLLEAGKIVRLGYGVYAKARPSTLSGKPVARVTLAELAQETLLKLGVALSLGRAQAAYAAGETTQIPVHTTFNTGRRRISRKIAVGASTVRYENDYRARGGKENTEKPSMTAKRERLLTQMATTHIWWLDSAKALRTPEKIVIRVMDKGTPDEVQSLKEEFSKDELSAILNSSTAGELNPNSWKYWHVYLGLAVPPFPDLYY